MGAPSKRARKVRAAKEFDIANLSRRLSVPNQSRIASFSWTLEQIRQARDAQIVGHFALPAAAAKAMLTDDAIAVAYENRLAPQRCIPVEIVPGKGARAGAIAGEAEALFGQNGVGIRSETIADIEGCLVNHGVAFAVNVATPRADGSRVDLEMHYWPIEYVRWDSVRQCFMTRVDPQSLDAGSAASEVPIVHGDGRWVVFRKHEDQPWTQEAALLPALIVWARHAYAVRDWAKGSVSHGNAKIVGKLPPGIPLQQSDAEGEAALSAEAAAFLEMLKGLTSDDMPVGIAPAESTIDFMVNGSSAWQVWSELILNAERAAARIYLGTDGVLGAQGGAPGVDVQALFGVAATRVQGDLNAIEQGILTGVIEPWCAMNFGDSALAPTRRYQIPDADESARVEEVIKRYAAFFAAVKEARDSGFEVTQGYVDTIAKKYGVEPPKLRAPKPAAPAAPPNTLSRLDYNPNQPRADDGKFGTGPGSGGGPKKDSPKPSKPKAEKPKAEPKEKPSAPSGSNAPASPRPQKSPTQPDTSKMQKLGEGANRNVYDAGDGTVIKVAKNAKARKDNKTEVEYSGKDPLLADVKEFGENYAWVRQEKLRKTSSDELAKHFGVSPADAKRKYTVVIKDAFGFDVTVTDKDWLYAATHAANGGSGESPRSSSGFQAQLKRVKKVAPRLDLRDFAYPEQWGISGGGAAKIADYGFTG